MSEQDSSCPGWVPVTKRSVAILCAVVLVISTVPTVGNAQQVTDSKTDKQGSSEQKDISGVRQKKFPPIKFSISPKNLDKPCLIYHTIGSLRLIPRTDEQKNSPIKNPRLQVFPDGKIKTGQRGKTPSFEGEISRERVLQLMDLAVNKASIYELDSAQIATELQKVGRQSGSASLFRVLLEPGEHERRCPRYAQSSCSRRGDCPAFYWSASSTIRSRIPDLLMI